MKCNLAMVVKTVGIEALYSLVLLRERGGKIALYI